MEEKQKGTWGGARNHPRGSGLRPTLTSTVAPETLAYLKELKQQTGKSIGTILDEFAEHYKATH